MEAAVYLLGMVVVLACGVLLARGYRQTRQRLLLWSSICFFGLALSNALTFVDLSLLPASIDLHPYRHALTGLSMMVLIYGLVWDSE
jgi:hypothetical protein